MLIKQVGSKELFMVFLLGYLALQIAWVFIWSVLLLLTFPGDRTSGNSFFAWKGTWGLVIGDLFFALPIILTGVIIYLFTKSLKITAILTIIMFLVFIIAGALFLDGVYFKDLVKHIIYAISVG